MSDIQKKKKLTDKLTNDGFPTKEVVLSLEDFFEGNDDFGSIGCNIYPDQPSPQMFYETFGEIKQSGKAKDILIRIANIEEGDWFYTDTVYFITDISAEELKELIKELQPDEIHPGWMYGLPANIPAGSEESKVFSVWWD